MHITTQERKKLGKEWHKKTEGLDLKNPKIDVDWHNHSAGKYLSDVIFAANDGIVTTFAIVAGVAGAGLAPTVVIILGVANLLADGASMGFGNYLGKKSEKGFIRQLKKKEAWEIEKIPKQEIKELRDIFSEKGFSGDNLDSVVDVITSNKKVWIDTMLKDEWGVIDNKNDSPAKHGLMTFVSFIIAGALPLVPYFIFKGANLFQLSIITTGITLYVVGALRYKLADSKWWMAGFEMLFIGGIAAVVAFFVGDLLAKIF